jgi:hypothetical protein
MLVASLRRLRWVLMASLRRLRSAARRLAPAAWLPV